jgi:UDP-glucose 4-epimerase
VPLFIDAIADGRPIQIFGDGEQRRDFTYVDNVVDGTLRAADTPGANGRIFNIAASAPETVNRLAELVGEILGAEVKKEHGDERPGDIRDSWADVTAARESLGFDPKADLEEGLRRTIAHLRG